MAGKPGISGIRIPVESLLEKLGAGEAPEQLLEALPRLTPDAIHAALSFAAQALKADVAYPIDQKAA